MMHFIQKSTPFNRFFVHPFAVFALFMACGREKPNKLAMVWTLPSFFRCCSELFLVAGTALCCCVFSPAAAQHLVAKVAVPKPVGGSLDRYGLLYLSLADGSIHKYDTTCRLVEVYSPVKPGTVTLLEAWETVRVFAFYQDFQEYAVFNRFLSPADNQPLNAPGTGFSLLAAPAATGTHVWVFDQTSFHLKKIHLLTGEAEVDSPLDLSLPYQGWEPTFMREYQNQLYLCSPQNGIHVFDLFGNYQRSIPQTGIGWFGFAGDELYFMKDGDIVFVGLYEGRERKAPANGADMVFYGQSFMYLLHGNELSLYRHQALSQR